MRYRRHQYCRWNQLTDTSSKVCTVGYRGSGRRRRARTGGALAAISVVSHRIADVILGKFLSPFSLRDSAPISVLSHRWRSVWKKIPNLNLDGINLFGRNLLDISESSGSTEAQYAIVLSKNLEVQNGFLCETTEKFIKAVDAILRDRDANETVKFKLDFYLHKKHSKILDNWITHGIGLNTNELILKLGSKFQTLPGEEPYDFPCHLFTGERGFLIKCLFLNRCSLNPHPEFKGFKYLRSLELFSINVTESDIEKVLSNSLILEWLRIISCHQLASLKISHKLSQLKYLNVECCHDLQDIELNPVNLQTFEYGGRIVCFRFEEAPKVKRAYINFSHYREVVDFALTNLPIKLPHLETLFLVVEDEYEVVNLPKNSHVFCNLKHLVMVVPKDSSRGLLWLASLLAAAPFLEKFELHLEIRGRPNRKGDIKRLYNYKYNCLKTIEITGFESSTQEIELAIHLLNRSVALELMTINVQERLFGGRRYDDDPVYNPYVPPFARETAENFLVREVPRKTNLVIIGENL